MTDTTPLADALAAHQAGQLDAAESGYRAVLQAGEVDANTLQLLGVVRAQRGDAAEARELFNQAIAMDPELRAAHDNLGNLCQMGGDYAAAAHCYREAIRLDPDNARPWYNLGVALAHSGDKQGAIDSYRQVLALDEAHYDATFNLARLLLDVSDREAALALLGSATLRWPDNTELLGLMSDLHRDLGQWDQAADTLERTIQLDPSRAYLQHLVHAYRGQSCDAPPPDYVENLFDNFADDYDEQLLVALNYRAPMQLSKLLEEKVGKDIRFERLVDLGCGTGLSGVEFFEYCEELHGVDVSQKMISKAQARKLYTTLTVADITSYLDVESRRFDAFIASDVFIYVGRLEQVFELVARRAEPGALFLFSVEVSKGDNVHLTRTGRFAHSRQYIEGLARNNGFTVAAVESGPLRLDFEVPVVGNYFLLVAQ